MTNITRIFLATAITLAALCPPGFSEDEEPAETTRILPHDAMPLTAAKPLSEAGRARIEALITELARIQSPQLAMTGSSSGGPFFAPDGDETWDIGLGVKGRPERKRSKAMDELVKLGPAAIPALLAHLEDRRPTRLVFEHEGGFYCMTYIAELATNPANARERDAVAKAFPDGQVVTGWHGGAYNSEAEKDVTKHRITIGDACFSVLGQIVNRPYASVRSMIVISSPTQNPRIAKALRLIWGGADPRVVLARSLLLDLNLHGGPAEDVVPCAVRRLAYYFPEASMAAIGKRASLFEGLDLDWEKRWARNGMPVEDMLDALMNAEHSVAADLRMRMIHSETSGDALIHALRLVPPDPTSEERARIAAVLDASPSKEVFAVAIRRMPARADAGVLEKLETWLRGPLGEDPHRVARRILVTVAVVYQAEAERVMHAHAKLIGVPGIIDLVRIMDAVENPGLWRRVMARYLTRKHDFGDLAMTVGGVALSRLCDRIAYELTKIHKDLKFDYHADPETWDKQIEAMIETIDKTAPEKAR